MEPTVWNPQPLLYRTMTNKLKTLPSSRMTMSRTLFYPIPSSCVIALGLQLKSRIIFQDVELLCVIVTSIIRTPRGKIATKTV